MTRRRKFLVVTAAAVSISVVGTVAFIQGMFYANRKATIRMVNDECFYTVHALRALKDSKQASVAVVFDADMDAAALKLSEMCLRYPGEIQRKHYNLLVRVRDYRKQYGRDPQRVGDTRYPGVDKKVDEAIAYLESIHDMKTWIPFKFDLETGKVVSPE